MKTINGDLIMEEDMTFDDDLTVEGNILRKDRERFNLTVKGNLNAGNINAWDINALDIKASNIDARNIDAGNIDAGNIDARNIDAGNIDAGNIDALDISYYAVCFAYQNITCKSIKGRRKNAKYFCLDGEITIKKFCDKCGAEIKQ
jgi:hypothetical protein